MTLLVAYLFIAIGVSFLCSILEAVLLSVTHGYVESQLVQRPRRARALKEVKDSLDESIASILILNTFAHTMGAAGVGAHIRGVRRQLESPPDRGQGLLVSTGPVRAAVVVETAPGVLAARTAMASAAAISTERRYLANAATSA